MDTVPIFDLDQMLQLEKQPVEKKTSARLDANRSQTFSTLLMGGGENMFGSVDDCSKQNNYPAGGGTTDRETVVLRIVDSSLLEPSAFGVEDILDDEDGVSQKLTPSKPHFDEAAGYMLDRDSSNENVD